jgi:hypothetical protein
MVCRQGLIIYIAGHKSTVAINSRLRWRRPANANKFKCTAHVGGLIEAACLAQDYSSKLYILCRFHRPRVYEVRIKKASRAAGVNFSLT